MDSHESLVELIFSKCALVYGREFIGRWEGQDLREVRADWRRELGRVLDNPQAVKHALENLPPDRPPTVLQFRALCINRPDYAPAQLPAPKADPAVVARVLTAFKPAEDTDPRAWAWRLRGREESGDRLSKAQRDMWREALRAAEPEAA